MRKGGPATPAGKAVSSRNATRHGMLALVPVVPGMEQEADWEALRVGVFRSLSPQGHVEEELAGRVALLFWRLRRVTRCETAAIVSAQETAADDVLKKWAHLEAGTSALRQQLEEAQ